MQNIETNKNNNCIDVINERSNKEQYPLNNIIGHKDQKKELINILNWFNNAESYRSKGVSIPKGILLFGDPGNGKSFLIKELIKSIDAKIFIFKGETENIVSEINIIFSKARQETKAVIIIDELDLLINKDCRVIRALQENLDGVEKTDNILVLTATNDLDDIPFPLTRNGRLERLIKVPYLEGEEAIELLKKYFKDLNIELPKDFDEDEIGLQLSGFSCSTIKAILNDVVLRNGFSNITEEMIEDSINNISDNGIFKEKNSSMQVAVHEAGHAVVAYHFSKYFKVNKLNMNGFSGYFRAKEIEFGFWNYDKALAHIKISMAGNIAEKVIYKDCVLGSERDLQEARLKAYNLINANGYSSCWETLPTVKPFARQETEIKRRKNEKKIEKVLKKCEKETYKIVKKHIREIKELASALFEKKRLKTSEILAIIG